MCRQDYSNDFTDNGFKIKFKQIKLLTGSNENLHLNKGAPQIKNNSCEKLF